MTPDEFMDKWEGKLAHEVDVNQVYQDLDTMVREAYEAGKKVFDWHATKEEGA